MPTVTEWQTTNLASGLNCEGQMFGPGVEDSCVEPSWPSIYINQLGSAKAMCRVYTRDGMCVQGYRCSEHSAICTLCLSLMQQVEVVTCHSGAPPSTIAVSTSQWKFYVKCISDVLQTRIYDSLLLSESVINQKVTYFCLWHRWIKSRSRESKSRLRHGSDTGYAAKVESECEKVGWITSFKCLH